ncbi:Prefoldin [Paraphysoderma sedebokerense]|nr:Prefoldin [Paraphysoderma sedebokerense]
MATISDEALKKHFIEIQTKLTDYNRQLTATKTQIAVKERDKKLNELTLKEMNSAGQDTVVYKSVGKMFLETPYPSLSFELTSRIESLKDDVEVLAKKQGYLEKNISENQRGLQEMLEKRR